MAVKIRLTRYGKKKRPFYRVIVAKETAPRDGRFIEILGTYDPLAKEKTIKINKEKALSWIRKGAQPTQTVAQLLKKSGVFQNTTQLPD
jgi:small subunit ribosomal protein S16